VAFSKSYSPVMESVLAEVYAGLDHARNLRTAPKPGARPSASCYRREERRHPLGRHSVGQRDPEARDYRLYDCDCERDCIGALPGGECRTQRICHREVIRYTPW